MMRVSAIWFVIYVLHRVYAVVGPFPSLESCAAAVDGFTQEPTNPALEPSCEERGRMPSYGEAEAPKV